MLSCSPDVLSWDIVVWGKTGSDRGAIGERKGLFGTGQRAEGRGRSHFAVRANAHDRRGKGG